MRAAGIDIAKAGYSALGLAVDGVPTQVFVWKHDNKKDSEATKIESFYDWLLLRLKAINPDIVSVEQVAGFHNRKVIQILSRFEGAALLAGKKCRGAIVLNPPVGSARNAALGVPANTSKEAAFDRFRAMYPDFKLANSNQGGTDQADAMTHALAAPTLLERR